MIVIDLSVVVAVADLNLPAVDDDRSRIDHSRWAPLLPVQHRWH